MASATSMRVEDIPDIENALDLLNSVQNTLDQASEAVERRAANPQTTEADEEFLRQGRAGLKRCKDHLANIRVQIEKLIVDGNDFPKDLMRVMIMRSDLNMEIHECSICLIAITRADRIWSCCSCFHVLHLDCVKQHATIGYNGGGIWRCPVCRHDEYVNPNLLVYKCYCGAVASPPMVQGVTAHGCGQTCRKKANCLLQCHPAACPRGGPSK